MNLYWPMGLVVVSNTFYHICSKSLPERINPFAALTVTYLVGAAASVVFYFCFNPGGSLLQEYRYLNWTSPILGMIIVMLEAGWIYLYKAGWSVNTGYLVQSAILAAVLLFVGLLLYKEAITLTKVLGMIVCMGGIVLMTK